MRFDFPAIGRPQTDHKHPRLRGSIALLAGSAGGIGILVVSLAIVSGVTPLEAAALWGIAMALIGFWLTGVWWRWDAPDKRDSDQERERRGF